MQVIFKVVVKLLCSDWSSDPFPLYDQRFEAKEKESATLPVKKGTGKGKVVKVKEETLPTPQGRRVVPRVTSTMKAEANRKADIKKGEGKRGKKIKVCLILEEHIFGQNKKNLLCYKCYKSYFCRLNSFCYNRFPDQK